MNQPQIELGFGIVLQGPTTSDITPISQDELFDLILKYPMNSFVRKIGLEKYLGRAATQEERKIVILSSPSNSDIQIKALRDFIEHLHRQNKQFDLFNPKSSVNFDPEQLITSFKKSLNKKEFLLTLFNHPERIPELVTN